ncbi:MAG: G8 domain-containing protein [Planctomycetes bacterium]|nr:G8 domain-containing protein [Planctomycetota bacterium]
MLRLCLAPLAALAALASSPAIGDEHHDHRQHIEFSVRSVQDGSWSDPATWRPARVPKSGDRVLVSRETRVEYDVKSDAVLRLVQVVGRLDFARDRDTEMNVGVLKVQNSDECSESGFACDFAGVNLAGEPLEELGGVLPALTVGTPEAPIPAEHNARIRLHYLEGMSQDDAPALVCCSARMELHGAPMSRTWVKLGRSAKPGDTSVTLAEPVEGWRVGDEVIVTGSEHAYRGRTFRNNREAVGTEERRVTGIDGAVLHLDKPLEREHYGEGEFRSEVANLSRNVIVESADHDGIRGHTLYHAFSKGSISYARFAHLGKEGVLGRYAIHFHLLSDTMRGGSVIGASIVDSHNRWITIHGTEYLVVRDCVGYQSVGHGFFLEDGTEIYNLLDRNLGVQAYRGRRLPNQVLPFDPNDGAAFWWGNGRNSFTRNVACENDEYGFRYDMQKTSQFDSVLPIAKADGDGQEMIDVRTIPIWNFQDNETHTEGVYGVLIAANGNRQPDTSIRDERMLERIRDIDWTGPDVRHPHTLRNVKIWEVHYGLRPHSPAMLLEDVRIDNAAYGVYRPAFENQVYRNLHLSRIGAEPFNRGMDDASAQTGRVTVDGMIFENFNAYGLALVQISDNNLSGDAETHFRNVALRDVHPRRAFIDRGGGALADPVTEKGVPVYVHDHFGPGRHAKVVSDAARDVGRDGEKYAKVESLTGEKSLAAEVSRVEFPELLDPVDDHPPATIILSARREDGRLVVSGVSHDNGEIDRVMVNGQTATITAQSAGVADWEATIATSPPDVIIAHAIDQRGNIEQRRHEIRIERRAKSAE